MTPFDRPPIGMNLARTSKLVAQAFDAALVEAGGTLPVWLTLLSVKSSELANQRELAGMIGIQGATLTHHLNAMEAQGLLTRRRDPDNRRVHLVELTQAGETMFLKLRAAALIFDKRLRAGLPDDRLAEFAEVLAALRANVAPAK
ncbi:MarR family transcriptional regulator [Mesorhizobium sp. LSJC268A00]|jgi:MarR family transcriptional regulator for hemolysin|uniref:MarR family winged helix-turn-helix transcriptional regulator n=2 Tax=unclassified Mesorhizobium TaxID=325217 RepID=UPI0003CE7697|nr:MarR family transcriptional regulator [Mesorhizobium sp. LSJC277A00]ESW95519.1 MarR family transcriptional regulator [Mesorhizobium sp. LSJC268A00]ESX08205.1 MarR family transcriptional regulator [Mesorhizobium sp. LSJC265A00]ESX16890.1 MarR family transcriptional regulator [Mesorhizobium sp. LSJC255A00]ESX17452.1 MarR family transcriptional regulator [Mesorhizobium sp. LSJC264A00]ESX33982.1 MarR family transcriptional regulator [Mesorhizobium sp. LSHC432A00]ESX47899.1 MarR family transcri